MEDAYRELKSTRIFLDNYTRKILHSDKTLFDDVLKENTIDYRKLFGTADLSLFNPLKKWTKPDKISPAYLENIACLRNYLLQNNIGKMEKITGAGLQGEEKLYQATNIIGDRIRILRNIRLRVEELEVEHDMIIIAPTGIFTVEVKNLKGDHEIDEKGILRNTKNKKKKSYNVAGQARRHINNLRRFFETITTRELNIYSIIVWANDDSKIINKFKFIPVCYCNTLEYEIFNKEHPVILSHEEMEDIYKTLMDNVLPEREYPINIDIDIYLDHYIKIMYAIQYWLGYVPEGQDKIGEEITWNDVGSLMLQLAEKIYNSIMRL